MGADTDPRFRGHDPALHGEIDDGTFDHGPVIGLTERIENVEGFHEQVRADDACRLVGNFEAGDVDADVAIGATHDFCQRLAFTSDVNVHVDGSAAREIAVGSIQERRQRHILDRRRFLEARPVPRSIQGDLGGERPAFQVAIEVFKFELAAFKGDFAVQRF